MTNRTSDIAVLTVLTATVGFSAIAAGAPNASTPAWSDSQPVYVGRIEMTPVHYRTNKMVAFQLLNKSGAEVGCGTSNGARPTWYYLERCDVNDRACDAAVNGMVQLLITAKATRQGLSVYAPNCKVDVVSVW